MYIVNRVRKVLARFIRPITPRGVGALTGREHWTCSTLSLYIYIHIYGRINTADYVSRVMHSTLLL